MDAEILTYRFQNPDLFLEATTHRSWRNEHQDEGVGDNERLEFLGDAVLDLVVGRYLFENYPDLPEGDLTRIRAEVVCEEGLAGLAENLNVGDLLRLGRGELKGGGREKRSLRANAFEALTGAVFLDSNLETVVDVFGEMIGVAVDRAVSRRMEKDVKSKLQELVQERYQLLPEYRLLKTSGPDHAPEYEIGLYVAGEVQGVGRGRSKKAAEQQAAAKALNLYL